MSSPFLLHGNSASCYLACPSYQFIRSSMATDSHPLTLSTVEDCNLDGNTILLCDWQTLSSDQLARIVGVQEPGDMPEYAHQYEWRFVFLPVEDLRYANQYYEEPDGGWPGAHQRHLHSDRRAVAEGSPEYAGRDVWLRDVWGANTAIYPLYVLKEEDGYRLLDGHRRLAGAFSYGVREVAVLLGTQSA